jgi:hypothetical protein
MSRNPRLARLIASIGIAVMAVVAVVAPPAYAATGPVQEKCVGEGFNDVSVGICVTSSGVVSNSAVGTGTFTFSFNGVQSPTLNGENPSYTYPTPVGPGEYTWSVVYQTTTMSEPATPDPFTFVVEAAEVSVTIIDNPALPPIVDDPLVKDDRRFAPVDDDTFTWVVNTDGSATATIVPVNTTFANEETSYTYPAPTGDVYNPPPAPEPPKGTIAACSKGKPVWKDGSNGQPADQLVQRRECSKAPKGKEALKAAIKTAITDAVKTAIEARR